MQHSLRPAPTQVFILCAGLGTRMRPLTDYLPKPLLPLFQESIIIYILKQYRKLGIRDFIINTHHLHEEWEKAFPSGTWEDCTIRFSHEPILLDSGGGLKKIRHIIHDDCPLIVHNGDIVTTLDASPFIKQHCESNAGISMLLKSSGDLCNVGFSPESGKITDIRNALGISHGTHQFTGIYCIQPEIIDTIPGNEEPVSVVPTWLELLKEGRLAGTVIDDGLWFNVGSPETYLQMHKELIQSGYGCTAVHETVRIAPDAELDAYTVVGKNAVIGEGCKLSECIVWPGVSVPPDTKKTRHIFFS